MKGVVTIVTNVPCRVPEFFDEGGNIYLAGDLGIY